MEESQYETVEVKKVITAVENSKVKVDKIKKVVTETKPTYVTYTLEVESGSKPYEVTVIDNK